MKVLFPLPRDPHEAALHSNEVLTRVTAMARKGKIDPKFGREVRESVTYITVTAPDQMYMALCLKWPEGHWLVEYMDADVSSPERGSPEPQ